MTIVETYTIRVYMAGDIAHAKQLLRAECYGRGLCVTIEPTTFIYTGGEEAGFVVGFVNYPRFPSKPAELMERAKDMVYELMLPLNQRSALLVAPDKTIWITVEPPGART
jgi:hypothetical protein